MSSAFYMLCLWAIPYGAWRRSYRCGTQPTRRRALFHYSSKSTYELAALFLGRGVISPCIMVCTDHLILAERFTAWYLFFRWGSHNDSVYWHFRSGKSTKRQVLTGKQHRWLEYAVQWSRRTTALAWIFLLLCIGIYTLILWSSSYLVSAKIVSAERAAAYAALFCSGILLGRFLAGFCDGKD